MRERLESVAVFFEREAGYHLVSLAVIVLGVYIADPAARAAFAHDLVIFGLGVLARSMGAKRKEDPKP